MADNTTADHASGRIARREAARIQLRGAIAEEYAAKLPDLLTVAEFARFAGMTIAQVRHATTIGELVMSIRDGRRGIAPADNVAFLLRERLLRLPVHQPSWERRDPRSLAVSEAVYERVWDVAIRYDTTPTDALDRLLLAATHAVRSPRPSVPVRPGRPGAHDATEPAAGLEPATARLQGECSTN